MLNTRQNSIVIAIFLVVTLSFLNNFLARVDNSEQALSSGFSQHKAMAILERILGDQSPHPVGSDSNRKVKQQITSWLQQQGHHVETQNQWGCSQKGNSCAWVENILATLPAAGSTKQSIESQRYIVLMAHYDSTPFSPGAGDDGAGVATAMEVFRQLSQLDRRRNPVLLLLTDGEETGLHGAEAFFQHHPLKDSIGQVINIEGSGSAGPSRLLRSGTNNGGIIQLYARSAMYPNGLSLSGEIFKHMPNDTDFSVPLRYDIGGADFAFAGERNHYHTKNDNIANLSRATLQHHGENVLPLARALIQTDLSRLKQADWVYGNYYGHWVQWPQHYNLWLFLAGALLLILSHYYSQQTYTLRSWVLAFITPPLAALAVVTAVLLVFKSLQWPNGPLPAWPENRWAFLAVLYSSSFLAAASVASALNQRTAFLQSLQASIWWLSLLSLAVIVYAPKASPVLLLPQLATSLLLLMLSFAPTRRVIWLGLLSLFVPVATLLDMAAVIEVTQGFNLVLGSAIFIALFFICFSPFVRGQSNKSILLLTLTVLVISCVLSLTTPMYNPEKPQLFNLHLTTAPEAGQRDSWQLRTQTTPPIALLEQKRFSKQVLEFPWGSTAERYTTLTSPTKKDLAVDVKVRKISAHQYQLQLNWPLHIRKLMLVSNHQNALKEFGIAKHKITAQPSRRRDTKPNHSLTLYGGRGQNVTIDLHFTNAVKPATELYLVSSLSNAPNTDSSHQKPTSQQLKLKTSHLHALAKIQAMRGPAPLSAPVHQGDEYRTVQKLQLPDS